MSYTVAGIVFFILGAVFSGFAIYFRMRQKNEAGEKALAEAATLAEKLSQSLAGEQAAKLELARLQSKLDERLSAEVRERTLLEEQHKMELENCRILGEKELQNMQEKLHRQNEAFQAEKELLKEQAQKEMASLREAMELLRKNYQETREELEKNFQTKAELFKKEFETISNKLLSERSASLQNSNKELMENLLTPLKEKMVEFQKAVMDSQTKGVELHTELKSELAKMAAETQKIGNDAVTLAQALKGEQKTQGNFGEMILEDLLEKSGLKKGIHFESQVTIRDDDGKAVKNEENSLMRPDVILHYPDGKDLIVDSKMSLTAYVDYMNSTDETTKEQALARHIKSVRNHVKELSDKGYSTYLRKANRETMDFVVMFIPGEGPANLALISEPALWTEAFEKKVLIVSPVNLLALLRLIHIAWTKEEQTRNQLEILDTASQLLERVYNFCEEFDKVGSQLEKALSSYQDSIKKLKGSGRERSILHAAMKLGQLGIKMKKPRHLPTRMLPEEEELLLSIDEVSKKADEETLSPSAAESE